ncbi:MAG: hypothetical protein ACREI7_06765 [Myxococcota bacterium]
MKQIQFAALAAVLVLTGAGCREEGPAERAGRAIDDAAREVGDELRELVDEDGPLERAGREADEALSKMKKAIEKR